MEIIAENQKEKEYIFKPTRIEEIRQNIENIINRTKGTIPLAREKGKIIENTDKPQVVIQAEITADIVEELEKEEPRFKVIKVSLTEKNDSKTDLNIIVEGEIIND